MALVHVFGYPDEHLESDARICETHPRDWQRGDGRPAKGVVVVYHPHNRKTEPGHDFVCCVCGEGIARSVSGKERQ